MKCFIIFHPGREWQRKLFYSKMEDGSNGTIVPFVTSDDPGRAHEMCWILDVRSLTDPLDLVISSPKTKGFVINQAEWNSSEDSANVSQDRTGQNRAG